MTARRRFVQSALALAAGSTLPLLGRAESTPPASPAPHAPLIVKPVPSTGVLLPVIGIGTNRFRTGDAEWTARLRATIETFARLGGQVIDTAPAYGDSESAIGQIVGASENIPDGLRRRLFLATKIDRPSESSGRAQLADSLRALQTTRLDLVQVHSLRGVAAMLPLLRDQQAAGRVRHVGVTTSSDHQYDELEALLRRERLDFVQLDYALGNRNAEARLLPLAADRGVAVLANLPFGRGRQFSAVDGRPLPGWAAEIDCSSWAQVFLKWVVGHPAVTCAIPGMTRAEHVVDNLGAARGRLPDAALRRSIADWFDAIA